MRQRKEVQLFPRKTKQKKNGRPVYVWYYRTWSVTRRGTAHSTGQTSKSAAEGWLKKRPGALPSGKDPFFKAYTASWWKWDECEYVRGRLARGRRIGRTYVEICRGYLVRHIWPVLGELHLSEITAQHIEDLVMKLRKKPSRRGGALSSITINQVLASLKIIFSEGVRLGKLGADPTRTIEPLEENPRERSFLSPTEVRKLFNARRIGTVWGGDRRHYTLNLLAASTGMRLGEIQALQNRFVFRGYLQVAHGWTRFGLKEPKTKRSERVIPLPSKTQARLRELIELSLHQDPEDLVFWGSGPRTPIPQTTVLEQLYRAFGKIGITEQDRAQRNISFHSWRHFFNTFLRAAHIPDSKLQAITGHSTVEMTERYTHFQPEDFKDVLAIQEQIV